jgi:hypothetical protein
MVLRHKTWLFIATAAVIFALMNFHAWQPGIGGRSDRNNGVQPDGSELELYYGWPACYRAELLRSDDSGMGRRVLQTAPFYVPPYAEGWISARYVSWLAVLLDTAMALLGLVFVAVVAECVQTERWPPRAIVTILVIGLLLAAGGLVAVLVSANL